MIGGIWSNFNQKYNDPLLFDRGEKQKIDLHCIFLITNS